MIAIAALALVLGCSIEAVRLKRWRDFFLNQAAEHELAEVISRGDESLQLGIADVWEKLSSSGGNLALFGARGKAAESRTRAAELAETAAYHRGLKEKYRGAAARPWRSVGPDPPPPAHEHEATGRYRAERGEHELARAAYEEAIRSDPEKSAALNDLAWLLATCPVASLRDGRRAVGLASRACEMTGRGESAYLDTLAAAHAEAGDFKAAAEAQRKAIGLLPPGDPRSEPYRGRLELYERHRPYHEATNSRG